MDADRIYKNLGKRIKGLRKDLGQTQDQLAKQVGISRASLANIEAGRQQVLVHHLFALSRALQLESPAQLLITKRPDSRKTAVEESLPLAAEGLTDKQRNEVLNLMGGVLNNNHSNTDSEDV